MFHVKLQIIYTLHKRICKYHDTELLQKMYLNISVALSFSMCFFLLLDSVNRSKYDDRVVAILWFINSYFPFQCFLREL